MTADRSPHAQADRDPRDIHLDLHTRLDLLHNLLPPDEKQRALDHLAACPTCAELFRRRLAHHEILRSSEIPQTAQDSLDWSAHARQLREKPAHGFWRQIRTAVLWPPVRYATIIVSAVVVLMLVLPQLQDNGGGRLQLQWLSPLGDRITLRDSTLARGNDDLAAGFDAYARHDLEQAIELLAGTDASGPFDILRKAYLGSALARNGDHEQAASVLQTIDPETLPEDYDEALWALYVSLRSLERHSAADSLLHDLVRRGHKVAERARAELE